MRRVRSSSCRGYPPLPDRANDADRRRRCSATPGWSTRRPRRAPRSAAVAGGSGGRRRSRRRCAAPSQVLRWPRPVDAVGAQRQAGLRRHAEPGGHQRLHDDHVVGGVADPRFEPGVGAHGQHVAAAASAAGNPSRPAAPSRRAQAASKADRPDRRVDDGSGRWAAPARSPNSGRSPRLRPARAQQLDASGGCVSMRLSSSPGCLSASVAPPPAPATPSAERSPPAAPGRPSARRARTAPRRRRRSPDDLGGPVRRSCPAGVSRTPRPTPAAAARRSRPPAGRCGA